VPVLIVLVLALSFWTGSKIAAHIAALNSCAYGLYLPHHFDWPEGLWLIAAASGLKHIASYFLKRPVERLTGLSDAMLFYTAACALAALFILQTGVYDDDVRMVMVIAVIVLLGIVAVLMSGGGGSPALRWLAYAAFAFEVIYLYAETVGSILGTASFFFVLAVFVLVIAGLVYFAEKRFGKPISEVTP